jgi:uncharacterized protein (TIGR03067 family)
MQNLATMEMPGNFMRLVWLVALGCLLAGCSALSTADSAADAKKWQGTWKLITATYNGIPQTRDMEWIVDGDHYTIRLDGQLSTDHYYIKLDASRKQIDVFHHETPAGTYGGKYKGIYEINGDSLTVCVDPTGQQYPTSFDANPGSRRVMYQFRRE